MNIHPKNPPTNHNALLFFLKARYKNILALKNVTKEKIKREKEKFFSSY